MAKRTELTVSTETIGARIPTNISNCFYNPQDLQSCMTPEHRSEGAILFHSLSAFNSF